MLCQDNFLAGAVNVALPSSLLPGSGSKPHINGHDSAHGRHFHTIQKKGFHDNGRWSEKRVLVLTTLGYELPHSDQLLSNLTSYTLITSPILGRIILY